MKLETPLSFRVKINLPNGNEIIYFDRHEICQGCPEVGKISINNKIIENKIFGGPLLFDNQFIYIPYFNKSWFNSGFNLVKIDYNTLIITKISPMYQIIDLVKIEDKRIFFYDSLEQNNVVVIKI